MKPTRKDRLVLAVDFGDRRTGLAGTAGEGGLAFPLTVIDSRDRRVVTEEIRRVVSERGVDLVLVGIPLAPDGGLGARGKITLEFARELARVLEPVPVEGIDERHSSSDAHERLKGAGMKAARRKKKGVDAVAALVLLESWLNGEDSFPLDRFPST